LAFSRLILLIKQQLLIFTIFPSKLKLYIRSNQHICNPHNEVSTATKLHAKRFVVQIPTGTRKFSLIHRAQTASKAPSSSYLNDIGVRCRDKAAGPLAFI
jgi:hypothetical protein